MELESATAFQTQAEASSHAADGDKLQLNLCDDYDGDGSYEMKLSAANSVA